MLSVFMYEQVHICVYEMHRLPLDGTQKIGNGAKLWERELGSEDISSFSNHMKL